MKHPLLINAATIWLVLFAMTFLAPLTVAHAANTTSCPAGQICYIPLEPLPGPGGKPLDESGQVGSFSSLLAGLFRILISLGGLVAVLTLVIGGITYMVSDAVDKKDYARKRIQSSLWGLLILIASVLILTTINPQLLNFNFIPFGSTGGSSTNSAAQTSSQTGASGATRYTCYRDASRTSIADTLVIQNGDFSDPTMNALDGLASDCSAISGVLIPSPSSL